MGWASGSTVANSIWERIEKHLTDEQKPMIAEAIVDALTDQDWDTLDESMEMIEHIPNYRKRYGFDDDEDEE